MPIPMTDITEAGTAWVGMMSIDEGGRVVMDAVTLPRKHLEHATLWLKAALECPTWHWDPDQRECANMALADVEQALAVVKHDD